MKYATSMGNSLIVGVQESKDISAKLKFWTVKLSQHFSTSGSDQQIYRHNLEGRKSFIAFVYSTLRPVYQSAVATIQISNSDGIIERALLNYEHNMQRIRVTSGKTAIENDKRDDAYIEEETGDLIIEMSRYNSSGSGYYFNYDLRIIAW